ncbi:hypothetical protein [Streptomyces yangpuensis]|uniref:hypothetical protein n=1 Tax=Streptomyces yangpuensis TaxID=1648182 RepID=UPI0037223837
MTAMTAVPARRIVPLVIAILLTGGAASLSSPSTSTAAVAAPASTTASTTTDTDDDNLRTVERLNPEKRRTVKKLIRTVEKWGVVPDGVYFPPGRGNPDKHQWAQEYRTPCKQLDCLQN